MLTEAAKGWLVLAYVCFIFSKSVTSVFICNYKNYFKTYICHFPPEYLDLGYLTFILNKLTKPQKSKKIKGT